MKLLPIIRFSVLVLAMSVLYLSCTRKYPQIANPDTNFINASTVQLFNATVKSTRTYVYVDGAPISGAAVAFGGVFPGTATGFKVATGTRTFLIKDTLATSTQLPLTFTTTIGVGKSYTIFTYDTISSIKQTIIQNTITVPKDTSSMLRFANFIYNGTAVPAVDVYSLKRGTTTPLFANVPTATVTGFVPFASGATDSLLVYATGTTTPLLLKAFVTSLTPTRSYTSVYSGSYSGTRAVTTFLTY